VKEDRRDGKGVYAWCLRRMEAVVVNSRWGGEFRFPCTDGRGD